MAKRKNRKRKQRDLIDFRERCRMESIEIEQEERDILNAEYEKVIKKNAEDIMRKYDDYLVYLNHYLSERMSNHNEEPSESDILKIFEEYRYLLEDKKRQEKSINRLMEYIKSFSMRTKQL